MCSTSTSYNTGTLSDYEVLSEPKKDPGVVYTRVTPSRSIRNARHIYLGTHVGTYYTTRGRNMYPWLHCQVFYVLVDDHLYENC
jgi:hypothetical protein